MAGQGEPVSEDPRAHNFNSTVTVAPDGAVLAHCRKSFLYSTDETWASEGAAGFYSGTLPLCAAPAAAETCRVAMGICMDINPYKFEAPFHKFEFGNHARECGAELVVLSMAWSSFKLTSEEIQDRALEPDLETLSYWVTRFTPLRDDGGTSSSVILVMANRCGSEHETVYAGTSTVMRMTGEQVELWDVLGKGEERCLVVNTEQVGLRVSSYRFCRLMCVGTQLQVGNAAKINQGPVQQRNHSGAQKLERKR